MNLIDLNQILQSIQTPKKETNKIKLTFSLI
jgi:hypothetical protein